MITTLDVTAVIVTRGDCDLSPIIRSLVFEHHIVWNNAVTRTDEGAYGRYIAASMAQGVVYFQDDDCIVNPADQLRLVQSYEPGVLSALMPPERDDYKDTVLVGWGSLCDWNLPIEAFGRWQDAGHDINSREFKIVGADFIFPMLTPWKRLDANHEDLPQAHADNRTWGSFHNYGQIKQAFMQEARRIRDGA